MPLGEKMYRNLHPKAVVTANSGQFTYAEASSRLPNRLRNSFGEYFEKAGHNGYDQMYKLKKIPPKR